MAANYHHGPEIIELASPEGIVRDVKSAVTLLVGAAPVQTIHATPEARAGYINKRVIIRSREQAAAAFGPETAGYSIPQALTAIFNKVINGQSGGSICVVNVFDPDVHKAAGTPDPTLIGATHINGAIDAAGTATGFKLAYGMFNEVGYLPKILIAPRYSTLAGVRTEMEVVAQRLHAVHVSDLPAGLTIQQAIAERGVGGGYNTASERAVACYPQLRAYDPVVDDLALQPYSQHYAGVMVATDLAEGYHFSPSNHEMADVRGVERDISFYPGDYSSDTNALNEVGITTVMNMFASGFRTWGNRTLAFPTSIDQKNFVYVRRIFDMVHESILYYTLQRTDRPGTLAFLSAVEEDVNLFLRAKEGEGVLYGGAFRFNRTKTTSRTVADGQFYYTLKMAPVGITERLTVESVLDLSYTTAALGLAA
ncbi:phage tail sheath subtilisin-like domain-containing protein [Xanthobacter sp. VTT E-85241]|uniref:phage tail sheath family protein n=1 Tax=Roseixanthobacter finlandensis TaxID=3119922 RepID=UPI003729011F